MTVPANLGTPGGRTARRSQRGPAITGVSHRPALPAANQPIRVQARVHDPDGVASVALRYRIDPGSTLLTAPMLDDGTGGDLVAGDVSRAVIPGQPQLDLVAFRVEPTMQRSRPPAASSPPTRPPGNAWFRSANRFRPGALARTGCG